MFLAGEHADLKTLEWTKMAFKSAVLDHWWQTGILGFILFCLHINLPLG